MIGHHLLGKENMSTSTITPRRLFLFPLLLGRLILFALFQGLLLLGFYIAGRPSPADDAVAWWVLAVVMANIATIGLLAFLMKREGKSLWDLYRVGPHPFWKDFLLALGLFVLSLPLGMLPNTMVGQALFGDALIPAQMMFRPIPMWGLAVGLLFPLTIAFAEIPFYFAYIMPRLQAATGKKWLITLLCGLALAAQHVTLPFIPDGRYLLWRLLMYLPFALFIGAVMQWKPRLLRYFMVFHALMDLSALAVYFSLYTIK
jgi:hypothetical protein